MTTSVILLRLGAAFALIALNAFFTSVEFASVAVRRTRLEQLVAQGNAAARLALKLVDNLDRVIAASQLGITMASLALGWIGEETIAAIIEPPLELLLGGWGAAAAHTIGTVVAFALVTVLHIVLGEQVPKSIAIRHNDGVLLFVSRPMDLFTRVFRPLIALLDKATAAVLRLLGTQPVAGHRSVLTPDELRLIVRESQEGGALQPGQEEILQNVFDFAERQAREVMIPRPDVIGIEAGSTLRSLLDLFADTRHARYPVYHEDLDDVVGIVAVKDILLALARDPNQLQALVDTLVRPALFMPETADISDLFNEMRAKHTQMAVVIDEYGGMAGIVTLEELIEEIVGNVSDELIGSDQSVVRLDETTVEVDPLLRIDEINDQLNISLPEGEEYETLAGLILFRLQHIPVEGETLHYRDLELRVIEMKGPKIEKVQLRRMGQREAQTAGTK